ncbi:unnamed protein product [Mytilus coruscus]|uniref:Uncharacterized protein n=1 Tax=Mytilus coruscus TaxID=42192 RepID=A0A6J8BTG3_MYTCO|nr:unnamed protein product [Mytilus coruscus]
MICQYRDDGFMVTECNKSQIDEFFAIANRIDPLLKFTYDFSNTELTYLDTKVYKGERFKSSGVKYYNRSVNSLTEIAVFELVKLIINGHLNVYQEYIISMSMSILKQRHFVFYAIVGRRQEKSTMDSLLMILINALIFFGVMANMNMKFDYHVIEGNARYLENLETNLAENTVKIHTPAHNDVMESYQIQDFRQGQQMKCLPFLNQCRLRDIDRETAGDAGQITEGFIHSWNKGDNTINNENEEVVKEMYYVNLDKIIDDNSLVGALKEFHQDFKYPLYKEKKIPLDAEVLNITGPAGGRVKRAVMMINDSCYGRQPKIVFGIESGKSCNHLEICRSKEYRNGHLILSDCGIIQITSPMVYQCLCCPWVTFIDLAEDDCTCHRKMGW